MKRIGLKFLKKLAYFAGFLVVFLMIVTLIINFLFKDQLIQFVINQLNKQVDARIVIAKVDFSIWRQFPNASVQLDNISVQSCNKFRSENELKIQDTLIQAEHIFFEFNLIKLIQGKFVLKQVNVKNGTLKIKFDKAGNGNYNIIKSGEKSKESSGASFELKDLLFINTIVSYSNIKSDVNITGFAEKLRIAGNFTTENFNLNINSYFIINNLIVSNYCYILNKPVQLKANILVNGSNYLIDDVYLKLNDLKFTGSGNFNSGTNGKIKMQVVGNRLNLSQVLRILPEKISNSLVEYTGTGDVSMNLLVSGPMGKNGSPRLRLDFSLNNGILTHKKSGLKLMKVNLKGLYYQALGEASSSKLKVTLFSSNFGSGRISGDLTIDQGLKQEYHVNALYKLNLNELKDFLNIDTLQRLSGQVEGNVCASGTIAKSAIFKFSNFDDVVCQGKCALHDVGIQFKSSDYYFEKINGMVEIDNNLNFHNISLYIVDNDFLINGVLKDWLSYIQNKQKQVTLQADIVSRNLDLSKYFVTEPKNLKVGYSRELLFPENINLDLKLNINNFKLNKFNAKWATGYLNYKPKMFVLKTLSFETLDGKVNGNGAIIQDYNKNFIVKGQVDVLKLNLNHLFYTFNNFSQDILKDHHLRGNVSGKIAISSEWDHKLVLNQDKLLVDADITIENGALVNFEPMYSLSKFISINELKNINFSTLKNHIYIKDKQIIIPEMKVTSSAFDITASGKHLFDNHYTYNVDILLSDILWTKAKRAKKENEEFGIVEDDGLGKTSIPVSIVGFNNVYTISYDRKRTVEVVKESFKNQKTELKSIFNQEFGWHKGDSTLNQKPSGKKHTFKVDWDDADENAEVPGNESKGSKSQKLKTKQEARKVEWE